MMLSLMNICSRVKSFIKETYRSIKNVCLWLPTIYNDRDWDYSFLWLIEKKKLQRMKLYFEHTKWIDATDIVKYISICLRLIDIFTDEKDYLQQLDSTRKVRLFNTDVELKNYSFNHYVNIKNAYRFKEKEFLPSLNNEEIKAFCLDELYKAKALHLYYKIMYYKIYTWSE